MKIIAGNGNHPKTPNWYHFKQVNYQPPWYSKNDERIPHKVSTNVYYEFDVGDLVWFQQDFKTRHAAEVIERKEARVYKEPGYDYLIRYTGWNVRWRRNETVERWVKPFNGEAYEPKRNLNPRREVEK